jgi:hypothetical protein
MRSASPFATSQSRLCVQIISAISSIVSAFPGFSFPHCMPYEYGMTMLDW